MNFVKFGFGADTSSGGGGGGGATKVGYLTEVSCRKVSISIGVDLSLSSEMSRVRNNPCY